MHSNRSAVRLRSCLPIVLAALFAGCQPKGTSTNAVARIDDRTLTLEDIQSHLDTARGITEAQVQQYVQRWLADELLYREAVRRGLDRSDELTNRLEDIRRQLAINALLEKEIYTPQSLQSTDKEVEEYYGAHRKEFLLVQDVAMVSYALFHDRDAATAVRNSVVKGTPWWQALRQAAGSGKPSQQYIVRVDSAYQTQASFYPVELWRVAANAVNRDPSFPIGTTDGYYLVVVWKFTKQGQPADVKYVENEIRNRLAVDRRQRAYKGFLENLRSQHTVDVLAVPGEPDTAKTHGGE
jgi:hypothetical protein